MTSSSFFGRPWFDILQLTLQRFHFYTCLVLQDIVFCVSIHFIYFYTGIIFHLFCFSRTNAWEYNATVVGRRSVKIGSIITTKLLLLRDGVTCRNFTFDLQACAAPPHFCVRVARIWSTLTLIIKVCEQQTIEVEPSVCCAVCVRALPQCYGV